MKLSRKPNDFSRLDEGLNNRHLIKILKQEKEGV